MQFGFRANHSTTDAIFLVQRQIEKAWAAKTGQLSIVLLDWAKAFDKVSHTTLLEALLKFGIPREMVDMIASIYSDRTFQVRDGGQFSTILGQGTGIAQGCPLSPYLFIIMLSSLMAEVEEVVGSSMSRCLDNT